MNKDDLIREVTKVLGTRIEAEKAVEVMVSKMRSALRTGDKVVFHGLGSLHVVMGRARKGHNFKTGKTTPIPPRRRVKFTPAKDLF